MKPGDETAVLCEAVIEASLPIIDAHHHLWPPGSRFDYDLAAMRRDMAVGHNVVATVFVECMTSYRTELAEPLPPVGETEFVAAACAGTSVGAAIVGYADLSHPAVGRLLDAHVEAGEGRFRGVRHNVTWHEREALNGVRRFPRHLLLDEAFRRGLGEVSRRGLTYDVWLFDQQMPELAATADTLPELTIVADHLGGPVTHEWTPAGRASIFDRWRRNLAELARRPNVVMKIGGMGMAKYGFGFDSAPERPTSAELAEAWAPYVHAAVDAFGPGRCMFETNFPVDGASCGYLECWNAFKRASAGYSEAERRLLFAGTAARVYGLSQG